MVDSGASSNFLSKATVDGLGLVMQKGTQLQVRLADGKMLKTIGSLEVVVALGPVQTQLRFDILDADIPPILGMTFLKQVNPVIDWQRSMMKMKCGSRTVLVQCSTFRRGNEQFHEKMQQCAEVASSDDVAVGGQNHVGTDVANNDFAGLPVGDDHVKTVSFDKSNKASKQQKKQYENEHNCATKYPNPDLKIAQKQGISGLNCGVSSVDKKFLVATQQAEMCGGFEKCLNIAMKTKHKLVAGMCPKCAQPYLEESCGSLSTCQTCGSCVEAVPDCQYNPLALFFQDNQQQKVVQHPSKKGKNKSQQSVELVSLRVFEKEFKKGDLEDTCLCVVNDLGKDDLELNFTHRTSYGESAGDSHGKFSSLAESMIEVLKQKYGSVFKEPVYPIDRSNVGVKFEHEISLKDPAADPPKRKLYPLDNIELEELKKQISLFLETNRIVPSSSPYGAPILFAKKKGGSLRMCIDYRMLNQNTISDSFPLPRIDELLQRLDGAKVFSKLDLRDGYHQLGVKKEDQHKTAFTCRYGTFEFKVMPFGLVNAPSTFQRTMNRVFFDLLDKGVLVYLDDILIYSRTVEEHKVLLDKVFALLKKYKLYVKEEKCSLFLDSVQFLGHVVDSKGVGVDGGKVDVVKAWPQPQNMNQVQQFLGLCNYYRRFVCRFSELASPLTKLTRKDVPFAWNKEQQQSFDVLKNALCSAPVLKLFDPQLEVRVICDASDFCVGSVLEQRVDNAWHPVEFFSKRLNQAERNYSATEREFVAIKLSLERWRHFLVGRHVLVLTDHAALTYLTKQAHLSRRQARWLEFLSEFDLQIEHVKGSANVADYLSRIPGTEQLVSVELCSALYSCGIHHSCDLPDSNITQVNSVISVFDHGTIVQAVKKSQEEFKSTDVWFQKCCARSDDHDDDLVQVRDGIVCKLVQDHFCPIIPPSDKALIQLILSDLHSSALGGHLSRKKLVASVQKRFFWKNIHKDCEKFCKECAICQQHRVSTQKQYGLLQPLPPPTGPFQEVTMDFVTHLPTTSQGYDAIFTIVDRFSKYVTFVPMKTTDDARHVAELFFNNWICLFGMPAKIVSDRDTRFTSLFWNSLMQLLKCKVALSSSYHPQTDGQSERFHRSLEQILRCVVSPSQKDWDILLPQCAFALNSTVHSATNTSPFFVVYNREPQLPIDHAFSQLDDCKVESVENIVAARSKCQLQVKAALQKANEAMTRQANKHRRPLELQVGDRVYLKTDHLPRAQGLSSKLLPKWTGPYKVLKLINPVAVELDLPPTIGLHPVVHVSQLKPMHGQGSALPPPVFGRDQEAEFEVEAILGSKLRRNRMEYLVKWKGYPTSECTWEPETNLENA